MENKIETILNEIQVSGKDPQGNDILSVIVKRTYTITSNGDCIPSEIQKPIVEETGWYEHNPKLLSEDLDIYPFKLYTDIVVKGNARTIQKCNEFSAHIHIGNYVNSIQVFGNRKTYINTSGKLVFTIPEIIEEIPLRYDFAFGGRDIIAEKKIPIPPPELTKYLPKEMDIFEESFCRYKRNPLGKGFLVENNKESLEQLELPNLEDPNDLLQPETLIPESPEHWYKLPLPRCTDWVSYSWFPRNAYFGVFNINKIDNVSIKEVLNGWAEKDILLIKPLSGHVNFRCTSGASLGLQIPYVKPGENIKLINIHPQHSNFKFQLPRDYPKLWVDGRKGTLKETKPIIQSVVIEPDENLLSIVWRGSAIALRPYLEEELKTMPFKVEWNK